jgi:hypothetical protein
MKKNYIVFLKKTVFFEVLRSELREVLEVDLLDFILEEFQNEFLENLDSFKNVII